MGKEIPFTIAVSSFKGGTGKSALAINLATYLAKNGYNIALLDLDYGAPSLYSFFSLKLNEPTLNDVLIKNISLENVLINAKEYLELELAGNLWVGLSSPKNENTRVMIRRNQHEAREDAAMLFQWIERIKNPPYNVDVIILDTAPGMNFLSVNAISAADISIVLLRLVNADLLSTREMIAGQHAKLTDKILVMVNQLPEDYANEEYAPKIKQLINNHIINKIDSDINYLGIIPQDPKFLALEVDNMLEFLHDESAVRSIHITKNPTGSFSHAIESIANHLKLGGNRGDT
jgi:cellulose biosynthesis protein BcsQ